MTEQIDLTKLSDAEKYKLMFEQQQVITNCLAQMQQAQANIVAIQATFHEPVKEK